MVVKFKGQPVAVGNGTELKVGDEAPVAKVVTTDLEEIEVGGGKDKVQVLITVPSLDTPVCATETKRFNELIAGRADVFPVVISMDLPFASKRFCSTEDIENLVVASDFRYGDFKKKYSVEIKEGPLTGLLARTVFIVGKDGKIKYIQVVPEITEEPNYDDILKALEEIV
ncbi:MAG: thiol peroxidase [Chlorobi bacterium]|nr:thiol peroxidase [Chlorobiota bacterium]